MYGKDTMPNGASNVLDDFRQGAAETFDDAFETLFRIHQRSVYGWLLRIVRNPSTAEDLTVETFWRIYRAHACFDPTRGFEPWARTIATRVALDWLRTQRPETELAFDVPAPVSIDPGISAEIRRKTTLAFSRLPPKLRIAAVLAVVEELPHKEIAEALGISIAAVKVRVFRALRLLRKDLQQQGITP
jgi:RNA polymerase sigma-70 factor, ECF subfamily